MSTPTGVQSNLVPFAVSTTGVTYKNVVCKKSWNFNGTTPTNVEQTDCGPLVGLGSSEWSFDFEGILNTSVAGATEVSAKEMLDYWNNQTLLYAKVLYPNSDGSNFYIQGSGYITNFKLANQVGNLISFTATLSGNGQVDNSF